MSGFFQALLLALTIGVIFVNGWTDAPGAIVSVVITGSLSYGAAVRLAAVSNLAGIVGMAFLNSSVADTMVSLVEFEGRRPDDVVVVLCAAMLAIVLFAVSAWGFGIPTSESHALIAALSGASLALGGAAQVNLAAWGKVLLGLIISIAAGTALGWLCSRLLSPFLARRQESTLDRLQIASSAVTAFLHGAQDGQKFIAVLVIVDLLVKGAYYTGPIRLTEHWLALLLCGAVMALGTMVGGRRIIHTMGEKMVSLKKHQGICADLAGGGCLLLGSVTGIPMSTTHTKTTAIMGTGLAKGENGLNLGVVRGMVTAWLVTFPVCGILGWLLARGGIALLAWR